MTYRDGWRRAQFGDVVRNVSESVADPVAAGLERAIGLEHLDPGELGISRWAAADGLTFTRRFRAGQVLYGRRRVYQRKAAVPDFNGVCSGDIYVLEPSSDTLLPELLPFIVQSEPFHQYALRTSAGSLSPRTKWGDLAKYEFDLPPVDEQRELASQLRACEALVTKQRQFVQALEHCRSAAIEAHVAYQSGAQRVRLSDVAEVRTGIAKGKKYGATAVVEVPYLAVVNVQDGFLDLAQMKRIAVPKEEIGRYSLRPGDVLLTEGGDLDKLGRGTVWSGEIDPCLHQNHVFCVRPDRSHLLPEYLSLLTGSRYGKSYFLKCAKRTSNLASINSAQVKAFPLPLAPLSAQEALLAQVTSIREALGATQHELRMVRELKAALMEHLRGDGIH